MAVTLGSGIQIMAAQWNYKTTTSTGDDASSAAAAAHFSTDLRE